MGETTRGRERERRGQREEGGRRREGESKRERRRERESKEEGVRGERARLACVPLKQWPGIYKGDKLIIINNSL